MSHTTYRNRHNREEHHFGTMEATLVELSSALGVDLPAGTTLEAAIASVNDRITRLENADVYVRTMKADAVIKASVSGSFTADAWAVIYVSDTFSADAVLLASIDGTPITADAWFAAGSYTGSFTADAVKLDSFSGSFTADAWRLAAGTVHGHIAADAYIVRESEATLGDMTLGDNTLGG